MENDIENWHLPEPPSEIEIPVHAVYIFTDGKEPELDWLELDEFLTIGTQYDDYQWASSDYEFEPIKPPFVNMKKAALSDWDRKGFLIVIGDGEKDIVFNRKTFDERYKEYFPFVEKKLLRDAKGIYERCLLGYRELESDLTNKRSVFRILNLGMRLGEASAFMDVLRLKGVNDNQVQRLYADIMNLYDKLNRLATAEDKRLNLLLQKGS